jgi:hypothetical protein
MADEQAEQQGTIEQLRALAGPAPLNCATVAEVAEHMADELFLAWYHAQTPEQIAAMRAELDALLGEPKP